MPSPISTNSSQERNYTPVEPEAAEANRSIEPPPVCQASPPSPSSEVQSADTSSAATSALIKRHDRDFEYSKLTRTPTGVTYVAAELTASNGTARVGSLALQADGGLNASVAVLTAQAHAGPVSFQAEALSAQASIGTKNSDGSEGAHIKVGASWVSAEGTIDDGANSLTLGVGVGPGLEASSGIRDADQDGRTEWCVRVGAVVTGGICLERGALADAFDALSNAAQEQLRSWQSN